MYTKIFVFLSKTQYLTQGLQEGEQKCERGERNVKEGERNVKTKCENAIQM